MRNALPITFALVAAAGATLPAVAARGPSPGSTSIAEGDRTVGALLATCETQTATAQTWCSAYLTGAADTLSVFGTSGFKGGLCRADYKAGQLPLLFVAWARKHPDMRNFEMLAGVTLAFHQMWPCR